MKYYVIFADESAVGVIFSDPKQKGFYCRALVESFHSAFNTICDNTQARLVKLGESVEIKGYERGSKDWIDSVLLKLEDGGYWKVGKVGEIVESNEEIDRIVEKFS
jgi:hypothetical protein